MNGWTRGCHDKVRVRGQTAASRHLFWETSTARQQCKREKVALLCEDTLHIEWLKKKSTVQQIRFPQRRSNSHNESTVWSKQRHYLISSESCSPLLWNLSSPKTESKQPMFLSLGMTIDSTKSLFTLLETRESMPKHILIKGCTRSWIN